MNLVPQGSPKNTKKQCKNGRAKMEARSQKIRGLNLNPLAPAQSKRTFAFSVKTQKIMRNASISAPFFASFLHLFRDFSGKAEKQVQGPSPGPQKHVKMDLKGAKTEPKNQQSTPQGPTKDKLPRPGARRRRRRSAAVPCTSCRRVGNRSSQFFD